MYSTPLGQVRLLIADTDLDNQLLSDDELNGFLQIEKDSVKRAAATALDAIASSEALIAKKITTQDVSSDGSAVAAELRKHAQSLRAQAAEEDALADDDAGDVYVLEFEPYPRSTW